MRAGDVVNRELDQLVADLRGAGEWAQHRAVEVTERRAERVRDDIRRLAPRTGLPHYAAKITHEVRREGYEIVGEIGAERGGQGSLAHILEFGTSRTPPHAHHGPGLDLNEPGYVKDMADLLDPFER